MIAYVLYAAVVINGKWAWQPVASFDVQPENAINVCVETAQRLDVRVYRCLRAHPQPK